MSDFGTPFVSSTFSRVTGNLAQSVVLANILQDENSILRSQEELSTGRQLVRPSDDPIGTQDVLGFSQAITERDQFSKNIDTHSGRLDQADGALQQVKSLIDQARSIAIEQASDTSTAETRANASVQIEQILQQAVNLGNTKVEGRYIFGGSRTQTAPFAFVNGGVVYQGDEATLSAQIAEGLTVPIALNGAQAFGALSSEITGKVDLDPGIVGTTPLSSLNGGQGVHLGAILVGDGVQTPQVIDLTGSNSVQDVLDKINAQTGLTGVTASVSPAPPGGTGNGILLSTGTGNVVVDEVGGNTTAHNLGVFTGPLGAPAPGPGFEGADLAPVLTPTTTLAQLFSDQGGLDLTGIRITNSLPGQGGTPVDVSFAGANTIEDILNRINNSGAFVEARINQAGTGIDVVSRLNGGRLKIDEIPGGTTASQLGLLYRLQDAQVADLNNGLGIDLSAAGPNIQVTLSNGSVIKVDLHAAKTVQDVINLINSAPGNSSGFLTASVDPVTGNRLVLTDSSGGPPGVFQVISLGGGRTAEDLQLVNPAAGAGPFTITGNDLQPAGVQSQSVFTVLAQLRDALKNNDPLHLNAVVQQFAPATDKVLDALAIVGTRGDQLQATKNRLTEESNTFQKLRSNVQDADIATVATNLQLQQVTLQAGLSAASKILQTNLFNFL